LSDFCRAISLGPSFQPACLIALLGRLKGYRSLIMFDPALKSGVVALWNSSANKPGGIEFEVMDMLYRLPPKGWMGVEGDNAPEQLEPEGSGGWRAIKPLPLEGGVGVGARVRALKDSCARSETAPSRRRSAGPTPNPPPLKGRG
jgi:hypothetical protein